MRCNISEGSPYMLYLEFMGNNSIYKIVEMYVGCTNLLCFMSKDVLAVTACQR